MDTRTVFASSVHLTRACGGGAADERNVGVDHDDYDDDDDDEQAGSA